MEDQGNVAERERIEDTEGRPHRWSTEEWTRSIDEWSRSIPEWREIEGWIREHPEASVLGAAGVGVLAGSLLFSGSRPVPVFSERVQATAYEMADEVRDRTSKTGRDVSRAVSSQARKASKEAAEATDSARKYGEDVLSAVRRRARENPELSRMVANALYTAAAAVLVRKMSTWVDE